MVAKRAKSQERCRREENGSGSYGASVTSEKEALLTPPGRNAVGAGGLEQGAQ